MTDKMSVERMGEIMQTILEIILEQGGSARPKEILAIAEERLDLSEFEREVYEKSGRVRWKTFARFYTVDLEKAGHMTKSGGKWSITPQGESALSLPPERFMREAQRKYREWKKSRDEEDEAVLDEIETEEAIRQSIYEEIIEDAEAEIEDAVLKLTAYQFQDLVAELLAAMGYHVGYVAPPGPDGGIDIIAYSDPLGVHPPRLKVQVKKRPDTRADVKELRELHGILKGDDVGLFVSAGGFTKPAEEWVRDSADKHIDLMDLDRLLRLWKRNYLNASADGKALLPLVQIYVLQPPELEE